jgi:CheY-like chemotaxis protein
MDAFANGKLSVHFSVSDTGIGIPPEKRQFIFDPFTQAEDSITRRFGGTGLGLAISSRLVSLMGGRIWVTDGPNQRGSTFHFTALFRAAESDDTVSAAIEQNRTRLRILLAEDNPVNQLLATRMLEREGHLVKLVRNGEEAVEAALSGDYDLVLMDVEMPVMDGLEATRRIRAGTNGSGSRLQIVAITANASSGDEARCLEAGMDGFLTKPFTSERLRSALEAYASTA